MKNRTNSEICNFVRKLFPGSQLNVVTKIYDDHTEVRIIKSYSYLVLQFKHLLAFSKFFDTKDIDLENGIHIDGCDTCDYGSSYEMIVTLRGSSETVS